MYIIRSPSLFYRTLRSYVQLLQQHAHRRNIMYDRSRKVIEYIIHTKQSTVNDNHIWFSNSLSISRKLTFDVVVQTSKRRPSLFIDWSVQCQRNGPICNWIRQLPQRIRHSKWIGCTHMKLATSSIWCWHQKIRLTKGGRGHTTHDKRQPTIVFQLPFLLSFIIHIINKYTNKI